MITIERFEKATIEEKLIAIRNLRQLDHLNDLDKETLQYIFNWTVDYFNMTTDEFMFEEEKE